MQNHTSLSMLIFKSLHCVLMNCTVVLYREVAIFSIVLVYIPLCAHTVCSILNSLDHPKSLANGGQTDYFVSEILRVVLLCT